MYKQLNQFDQSSDFVRDLTCTSKLISFVERLILNEYHAGHVPVHTRKKNLPPNVLSSMAKFRRFLRRPISVGTAPVKKFFAKINSCPSWEWMRLDQEQVDEHWATITKHSVKYSPSILPDFLPLREAPLGFYSFLRQGIPRQLMPQAQLASYPVLETPC